MDFEKYLRTELADGKSEFRLVAMVKPGFQEITFYIHPLGKNGKTVDYLVEGDNLFRINSAIESIPRPPIEGSDT